MRNAFRLALLCGLVLTTASTADAQWGRGRARGGVVMGPDGPLYDTRSPEWQMSGGDFLVYQQLMQEKMEMARQKYMYQQMQQAAKQQNSQAKGKGKAKDKAKSPGQPGASPLDASAAGSYDPFAEPVNHYHRKKYKHTPSRAASTKSTKSKAEPLKKTP